MTVAQTADETDAASPPASRGGRGATWIAIGVALLVVGGVGAWITGAGQWAQRGALDPESAGPAGTRAIVEIMRDRGIDVRVVRDRGTAREALDADGPATLALADAPALTDEALTDLAARAADVVLLDPRSRTLDLFLPGSALAGEGEPTTAPPGCALAGAERAGAIAPGAVYTAGPGVTACYASGVGSGLLALRTEDGLVAAFDARAVIANDVLAENGNAGLGINLLAGRDRLVWYLPSLGDTDLPDTDPTLGELTPPWVSPVIALLLVAGVAAAIWRGRRFGPLVAERLPVSVRASETTEGRARLYAQSRDAGHAADQLRLATRERVAAVLGLGPVVDAGATADAAAAVTGMDPRVARAVLVDAVPRSDADLVALHQSLHDLERAVRAAARQEGSPS